MSIVVRYPPSNVTKQQYDALRSDFEAAGDWPADGCQLHVCFGPEDDIRVSEIWESEERFRAFGDTLMPKVEQTGVQVSGEPEVFAVHIYETF